MGPNKEPASFDALLKEQEVVQARKFQGRTFNEYSDYLVTGQSWLPPRTSAISDFLKPFSTTDRVSLESVIEGYSALNSDRPVHWADIGGGRALPMRQLGARNTLRDRITMTNVDLFDYGLDDLSRDELSYLENLAAGATNEHAAPHFIQANAETVTLPEPADIITSIEVMQYLNNPLEAMSNWYNQLGDTGLLLISAGHDWSSWIRHKSGAWPTQQLFAALEQADIPHAASYEVDYESGMRPLLRPDRFSVLTIKKRPGTHMVVNAPVVDIWVNPHDYKAVYYKEPTDDEPPLIEFIPSEIL